MTELMRELKGEENGITACPIKPGQLAALLKAVDDGTISGKMAKTVFEEMYATGKDPAEIIKTKGLKQVSDTGELTHAIAGVLTRTRTKSPNTWAERRALLASSWGRL